MSLYGRINKMAQGHRGTGKEDLFRDAMRKRLTSPKYKKWSNNWSCGQFAQMVRSQGTSEEEIIGIAVLIFT